MKSIFTNTAVNSSSKAATTKLSAFSRMVFDSSACNTELPSSTPSAKPCSRAVTRNLYGVRSVAFMPCSNSVLRGRLRMARYQQRTSGTGMTTNRIWPNTIGRNESRQMSSADSSMAIMPWNSTSRGPR